MDFKFGEICDTRGTTERNGVLHDLITKKTNKYQGVKFDKEMDNPILLYESRDAKTQQQQAQLSAMLCPCVRATVI